MGQYLYYYGQLNDLAVILTAGGNRCGRFPTFKHQKKKKICGFSLFVLSVAFQMAALSGECHLQFLSLPLDVKKNRQRFQRVKSPTSICCLLHYYTKGYIQIVGHGARI